MLEDSSLKYQVLLDISEALVACRDYDALIQSLWESLRKLIQFDFLFLVRSNQHSQMAWLQTLAGEREWVEQRGVEVPVTETPMEIVLATQQPVYIRDIDLERAFKTEVLERFKDNQLRSVFLVPLKTVRGGIGALSFASRDPDPYTEADREFMVVVGRQVAIAVENALAFDENDKLRKKLKDEKVYLEEEIRSEHGFDDIVGHSPPLRHVLQEIETVAPTDSTVLIQGETGTGKELVARAIHQLSRRNQGTFVKLNAAAIPAGLLESELFGHEKGAFTGALIQRIGRFELAHGGTLFLDEIGELPSELQPKLLRVLQDREFERVGGTRTIQSDVRLIAATNRNLRLMVGEQRFRMDLFYRLNVFPLTMPPLRDRREDIPLLVRHMVQEFAKQMGKQIDAIPAESMEALSNYSWPGNVRELRNIVERSVILTPGKRLRVPKDELIEQPQALRSASEVAPLEDIERRHILAALDATQWVVGGPNGAAVLLGLKRSTLQSRMERLRIVRARVAASGLS